MAADDPDPPDVDTSVSLIGDIDVANSVTHGDLLCTLLDLAESSTLLVDCSELEFLELRGMAMMVRVDRHGSARGTEVWWTGLSARHRQLLELAGLDEQLRLCPPGDDDATPPGRPGT